MSQKRLKRIRKEAERAEKTEEKVNEVSLWAIVKRSWKFLVLMVAVTVGLYVNGMGGAFVSDDYATITQNPDIGNFWVMAKKDSIGNSMYLANSVIYKIFGVASPIPYHVASLICYVIFLVLAFVFLEVVFNVNWLSKITMFLFAVHPIHVETVSWISGRIYLIISIYILASLLNFVLFMKRGKQRYLWYSLLFFILAFQTDKPRPFSVFLLIPIYVLWNGLGRLRDKIKSILLVTIAAGGLFVIVAWPYINNRIAVVNSGTNSSGSIFYNPLFQYPIEVTKYLQVLWVPADLTLYHTMYIVPGWVNWLVLILYMMMVVYFFFKDKRYFFALAFIFAATMPSMSPIKVSWLVAERYMFLGSLGFCLLLGLIIGDMGKRWRLVSVAMFSVIVAVYGIRVVLRNIDWQTNHRLWVNTCQVSPNSHNAWNNIGDDYDKLKDYANAIKGFTQSTIVKPNYADAYHNRANIFYKIGRLDLAREGYDTALRFNPGLYQTLVSLVQIDLMEKKYDLALQHVNKGIELDPHNPQTLYVLAVVYAQIGKIDEAKSVLKTIVNQFPTYALAKNALVELETNTVGQT